MDLVGGKAAHPSLLTDAVSHSTYSPSLLPKMLPTLSFTISNKMHLNLDLKRK